MHGFKFLLALALFLPALLGGPLGSLVQNLVVIVFLLLATPMIDLASCRLLLLLLLLSLLLLLIFHVWLFDDFNDFAGGDFLKVLRQLEHLSGR